MSAPIRNPCSYAHPSAGIEELHASCKQLRVELRGFDMQAELEVRLDPRTMMDVQVVIRGRIRDRDTGAEGMIGSSETISGHFWLQMDAAARARLVYHAALRSLQHELAECFYVDGVRVYDPHNDERP